MKRALVVVLGMMCMALQWPIQAMTHEFLEKEHIALLKEHAEDIKKMKTMVAVIAACSLSAYCGYWLKKMCATNLDTTLKKIIAGSLLLVPFKFAQALEVSWWVPGVSMITTAFIDEVSE